MFIDFIRRGAIALAVACAAVAPSQAQLFPGGGRSLANQMQETGANLVSCSVRARQDVYGGATNSNTANYVSAHYWDHTNARCQNPTVLIWNGYRAQSGTDMTEKPTASPLTYVYSILPAPNAGSLDQTGKPQFFASWNSLANDRLVMRPNGMLGSAGIKPDGTPCNYACWTAAGGSVTALGAGGEPAVVIPAGYAALSDPVSVDMPAGTQYLSRVMYSVNPSTTGAYAVNILGNSAGPDDYKGAPSYASTPMELANWTSTGAGSASGIALVIPNEVYAAGNSGVKTVWVDGDSIATGEPGDGLNSTAGYVKSSLDQAGYSWVATSDPSTKTAQAYATSYPIRDVIAGIASALVSEYGHNDGFASLSAAQTIYRNYFTMARAKMRPGATVTQFTLTPFQSGGLQLGGLTISSISSSGTTASAAIAAAPTVPLVAGQSVQIYSTDVPAYNGPVTIASVTDTTHFTFTIPGGGSGLATSSAGRVAYGAPPTGANAYSTYSQYSINNWLAAGSFNPALGDPNGSIDTFTLMGGSTTSGMYPDISCTYEGTHPLGQNTSGATSTCLANTVKNAFTPAVLKAGIGF